LFANIFAQKLRYITVPHCLLKLLIKKKEFPCNSRQNAKKPSVFRIDFYQNLHKNQCWKLKYYYSCLNTIGQYMTIKVQYLHKIW